MRVCIIGAGAAGLAAARHVLAQGYQCDVLEMGRELGGTWVYTDDTEKDQYGFPVYSAMYKHLRINLPKEVMGFPDYPIPEHPESYLTREEILDFLKIFADRFEITPTIKFNRMVAEVRPLDDKWQITSIDKPTKQEIVDIYDSVMVCNGHYNDPIMPKIDGLEKFVGQITHSQKYRMPEPFEGKRVLVIGAGPSGLDLALNISTVAKYVVLSHHMKEAENTEYPGNVSKKPDVRCVKDAEEIEFVDGSCCRFDWICCCTGYRYSFPFLHESCGITIDDNFIQPLYKHMIHTERPTMCFIGVPFNVCAFQMFDLQARFYCKYLNGSLKLPTTEDMRKETEEDLQKRWAKGYTKRQAHLMGPDQLSYYEELAQTADTISIGPVIVKLRDESVRRLYDDLLNFRKDRYKVVNHENFVKVN